MGDYNKVFFSEFWSYLAPEIKIQLESSARSLEFKRGDFIYREGDTPQGLYFVKTGLVGLVLIGASSGKEHLLRFFREDQFFGHSSLFANEGYHGSTIALEPTSLKLIPKSVIFDILKGHPYLYKDVVVALSKELRQAEIQRVMILENQILARTAQAVIYLKELHPAHKWTRQEIANFCASTVSTVIKALAELEARGLVRQDGRNIEVLDRQGLLALQETEAS